jgi:hypothetical protein
MNSERNNENLSCFSLQCNNIIFVDTKINHKMKIHVPENIFMEMLGKKLFFQLINVHAKLVGKYWKSRWMN